MSGALALLKQGATDKKIARELRRIAASASNVRADTLAARATASNALPIAISAWRPYQKNTLRGFFSATFPSGLVLHGLMLHESEGHRWVTFPMRELLDRRGKKQFAPLFGFRTRTAAQRFQCSVVKAINRHLANLAGGVR
jgi:hypothetical protein